MANNTSEEIRKRIKMAVKTIGRIMLIKILPIIFIILLLVVLLSGMTFLDTIQDAERKEGDWSNTPYAASQYTSEVEIAEDGTITTSMTAQELWDELLKNNSNITEFLSGPSELLELMNAEIITNYPDTRPEPDEPIDWDKINRDVNSNQTFGIIKFKRAMEDGKDPVTMKYANPDKFNGWIQEYNATGSEEARKNALTHFTIKKNEAAFNTNNGTTGSGNTEGTTNVVDEQNSANTTIGEDADETETGATEDTNAGSGVSSLSNVLFIGDSITVGLNNSGLIPGATFMAKVGVSPSYWLENINSLPIDSDNIQAVGVMLGVNNTSQTSQMKQLIDELISRYPGKTIYIQRVLPVTSNYTTINYNEMNQNISKYNSEIESYCSGKAGVKFIDTSAGYVDTSGAGVNNMFANDGLHPTNYEQLKTNIENAILNGGGGTVSGEYGLNMGTSKYYVVVATWSETQQIVESNDPSVATVNVTNSTMTTQLVNYQQAVRAYTMPFDYLWSWLVTGRDKKFALDVASLVYDSEIEVTIHDNVTKVTDITRYDYEKTVTRQQGDKVVEEQVSYWRKDTIINTTNTLDIRLTKADVWIVEYTQEFTYQKKDRQETSSGTQPYSGGGTITSTTIVEGNEYISSPANIREKTNLDDEDENFVKLLFNYNEVKNNILSAPDWLFNILENNERTADMVDLTKYLIYKATGSNFGVTSLDLSIFEPGSFNTVANLGGIYGSTIQEKLWFALRNVGFSEYAVAGVMGNVHVESGGFNPSAIEGGSGEGIGLIQWSFGRRDALEAYAASKGVSWTDVNTQIEFLIAEMTGEGANGYATYNFQNAHGYTREDWENATSPEDAAVAFCYTFERPGVLALDKRKYWAREYYNQFHGKQMSSGSVSSLLQAADAVAQYLVANNYTYSASDYNDYTFPIANSSKRTLSCSSYVQECLLQAGYTQCAGGEKIWARTNPALSKKDFNSVGIQVELIYDMNQVQPGDIIQYRSDYHVVIAYNVSGNNVQVKGVPEVLNSSGGFNGRTRTISYFQQRNAYIVRIVG